MKQYHQARLPAMVKGELSAHHASRRWVNPNQIFVTTFIISIHVGYPGDPGVL
jgi:hypothetical protein